MGGPTSFGGISYESTSTTLAAVMPSGTAGVNHGVHPPTAIQLEHAKSFVNVFLGISIDGNAALLTVTASVQ